MHNAEEKKPTFHIYVSTENLYANRRYNYEKLPVAAVRLKSEPAASAYVVLAREVLIHGASKLVNDYKNPIPFTNERTVAWVETDSDVSVRLDENDPRRQKHKLGGEAWIKLTPDVFDKLKELHVPRNGC